jgi:hypothetical protein
MAIIITNDGDRVVATLAARDLITTPFDGMRITVADSTGDIFTNGGKATYQWMAATSTWLLVWKENKDSLEFVTESLTIANGQVTATNVPQSGMVWGCTVQDVTAEGDAIIIAEIKPTVTADVISIGSSAFNGKKLVFTYGYGVIQAAVTQILSSGGGVSSADLALKADQATTFTKTEVNTALGLKADSSAVYTIAAVDSALAAKADQATTYTKTETNAAIQSIVGAAPAALDTLAEIAAQLASDQSAAAALTNTVTAKAPLASPTFTGTVSGITKAMVGLGSVDNTSDAAKPVSTAQATAIALKANLASPSFTGVVSDADGKLRSVPQVAKTAAYTLVAGDNGKNINITTGGITIPTSVFAAGDIISVYNQSGTAQNITFTGLTCYVMGTTTAKTAPLSLAGRGGLTVMFVTASEILVSGNV